MGSRTKDLLELVYTSVLLFTFLQTDVSSLTTEQEARIDNFVEKALGCKNLPGLSLAVVQNGQPVMAKGYGWANIAKRTPATNKTVFCIASVTKHFTAAALGTLMEPFILNGTTFHSKVKDILGDEFQVSDKEREGKISIADALSHRTGIGRVGLAVMMGGYNKSELFRRMRFVPAIREFREEFQYNNIMYAVAGKVAEKLQGGKSYEDIVTDNLFKPLGMTDPAFLSRDSARWNRDFATPYHMFENRSEEQSMELLRPSGDMTGPAGSVCLHSEDMTKWQQFLLNKGKSPTGQTVLEESIFDELVRDWVHVQNSPWRRNPAVRPGDPVTQSRDTYGLGLYTGYYRGYRTYFHGGFNLGITSELLVLPDVNISISSAINAFNGGASSVHSPLHMFIADILLGLPPWMNESHICPSVQDVPEDSIINQFAAKGNPMQAAENDRTLSTLRPLKEYVGIYGSYALGHLEIKIENVTGIGEMLRGTYGTLGDVILIPLGIRDLFIGRGQNMIRFLRQMPVQFSANSTDNVVSMTIAGLDPDLPPTFIKDLDSDSLPARPTPPPPATCPPIRSRAQTHQLLQIQSVLVIVITTLMTLL